MFSVGCWAFDVLVFISLCLFVQPAQAKGQADQPTVIIAVGAPGEEEYGKAFVKWAETWTKACDQAKAKHLEIGLTPTNAITDLAALKAALQNEPTNSTAELWLVLIGHGTFDGKEAKFNLRGPDLSAADLNGWLNPFHRPVIVIDCTASSSPFLNKLSAPGRVIVTATRSGYEQNFAHFGKFLAAAITDPTADLDKDGQTSLLEAFLMASRRVAEFYDADGRLLTEHALLDDNGDGLGTSADFFRGVRAVKKPSGGASVDGVRAHQVHLVRSAEEQNMAPEVRAQRDELELALARLRDLKPTLDEADYYQRLERIMIQISALYFPTNSSQPAPAP